MIVKLISLFGLAKENYKNASKSPLKWLAVLIASVTIPATVQIKVATMEEVKAAEHRTRTYVDEKHNQVIIRTQTNHAVIMDKLDDMHENIKKLDDRVYKQNSRR